MGQGRACSRAVVSSSRCTAVNGGESASDVCRRAWSGCSSTPAPRTLPQIPHLLLYIVKSEDHFSFRTARVVPGVTHAIPYAEPVDGVVLLRDAVTHALLTQEGSARLLSSIACAPISRGAGTNRAAVFGAPGRDRAVHRRLPCMVRSPPRSSGGVGSKEQGHASAPGSVVTQDIGMASLNP